MGKMGKFMKQAQKLQKQMDDAQKEIANSIIEVEAAGGAISVQITGDQVLQKLKINPEIVDPEDVDGLEDLILTAVNQAISEAKKFSEEKTSHLTEGLNLPGGMPF